MKFITQFRKLFVFRIRKKDDKSLFKKIQKKIAGAFKIAKAQDEFDEHYSYIISLDQTNKNEIVAGYRYILCKDAIIDGEIRLNTFKYYKYSQTFMDEYFPYTIELGRSFSNGDIFSLLSLWAGGLGPLIDYHKRKSGTKFLLGQVSLQENIYDKDCIRIICSMFWKCFGNPYLLTPREETLSIADLEDCSKVYGFNGDYQHDKAKLIDIVVKEKKAPKPTLFLSYADLISEKSGLYCALPVYNKLLKCYEMGFVLDSDKISEEKADMYLKHPYEKDAFE